jgi:hypothetical protein
MRDDLEDSVTGVMPEGVVDRLEPIEVDVDDADHARRAAGWFLRRACLHQTLQEELAVGQARERVVQ